MKRLLLSLWLLLAAVSLLAQDLPQAFMEARELHRQREFMSAARAFHQLADNAGKDDYLRVRALLAEGECYYAMDLSRELQECLNQVEQHLPYDTPSDSTDWVIQQAYDKLQGSCHILMAGDDISELWFATNSFEQALSDIAMLRRISLYDDSGAERTLRREYAGLLYRMGYYKLAADYLAPTLTSLYGFDAQGRPTDEFAELVSALALMYARLGDFTKASETLSMIPDWTAFPHYARRVGKIEVLRYDAKLSTGLGEAKRWYDIYLDNQLKDIDRRLAGMTDTQREQYWLATQNFLLDACRLGPVAAERIYDLALLYKGFLVTYSQDRKPTDWKKVQKSLKRDECAIEFVEYCGPEEKHRMAALVLKKDSKAPEFIDLFDVWSFGNQSLSDGHSLIDALQISSDDNDLYFGLKNEAFTTKSFFDQVWPKKLLAAIGDASKIYFAADGLFHAMPIEYMLPDALQNRQLYRLSSTRKLLDRKPRYRKNGKALLCSSALYYTAISPKRDGNDLISYELFRAMSSKIYVPFLTFSQKETQEIKALRKRKGDVLLEGVEATDEKLCSLLPNKWSVVHISTHGYSYGRYMGTDLSPAQTDKALSESGVLLTGFGWSIASRSFNRNLYDGCLSAREMSEQDFSKVGLVVLSACQTGLGYVSPEGVYGCQRGLKMGGADAMLLSLWSVNDYRTSQLMILFHEELTETKSVWEAFHQARERMIREQTKLPCYVDPFILIDAF